MCGNLSLNSFKKQQPLAILPHKYLHICMVILAWTIWEKHYNPFLIPWCLYREEWWVARWWWHCAMCLIVVTRGAMFTLIITHYWIWTARWLLIGGGWGKVILNQWRCTRSNTWGLCMRPWCVVMLWCYLLGCLCFSCFFFSFPFLKLFSFGFFLFFL